MQQIKELIEIDNNLNTKIKDIENKLAENASTLSSTKNIVEQFNSRLEFIEKNMEKFMGLYEVVTNRFNPFVSEENENTPDNLGLQTNSIKKPDNLGLQTNPIKKPVNLDSNKANEPKIVDEVKEIIEDSGVKEKLAPEQTKFIEEELTKAIDVVGPAKADTIKKELSSDLSKTIANELKIALEHHAKVSNEELKKAMKDMLLETITHIKNTVKQGIEKSAAQQTTAAQQTQVNAQTNKSAEKTVETGEKTEIHKEVDEDYHFYLANGTQIKSVKGLIDALDTMDDATFTSHVNSGKNDFAEWIRVVLNNNTLADQMRSQTTKEGIKKVLSSLS